MSYVFKNYTFTGTEQDLRDNGFQIVYGEKFKAIKRYNDCQVFVGQDNRVLSFNDDRIQELVDKGLVSVEVIE